MGERAETAPGDLVQRHLRALSRFPFASLFFDRTAQIDLKLVEMGLPEMANELAMLEERMVAAAEEIGPQAKKPDGVALILRRDAFRGRLAAMFTRVDLLAIPVLAFPVPSLDRMANVDDDLIAGLHRFTCPFNLSGSPGLVLPCGSDPGGLPIVFQLVGRHFEETTLYRLAQVVFDEAVGRHAKT